MSDSIQHNLIALLPSDWQDKLADAVVSKISGGVCNEIYHIEATAGAYALRINNPQPERLGLDPMREARALDLLAEKPWTPDVLYQDSQLMLTRWVIGKSPVGGEMTRLNWLTHALETVHHQTGTLPTVSIPVQLHAFAARCGTQADDARRHIDRLLAGYATPQRLTLCHHDWHPGNLVIGHSGWTLLDWEFAGLGDPQLDVGSAINGFALPPPAIETLSQLTGYSVKGLKLASSIMKALEIVWYAANPELKADAPQTLARWLENPPEATPVD